MKKLNLSTVLGLALLVFTSFAEAREFYEKKVKFKITATSVDEGTRKLNKIQGRLVYSDDHEVCELKINETSTECKIEKWNDGCKYCYDYYMVRIPTVAVLNDDRLEDNKNYLENLSLGSRSSIFFDLYTRRDYRIFEVDYLDTKKKSLHIDVSTSLFDHKL